MFHAADGAAYSSQLTDGMLINSLVQGADIRINIYNVIGKQVRYFGLELMSNYWKSLYPSQKC